MGFWDVAKRVGAGVATGGLSEAWNPKSYAEAGRALGAGGAVDAITGAVTPNKPDLSTIQGQVAKSNELAGALGGERAGFQGTADPGLVAQRRGQQSANISSLTAAANGTVPSAAAMDAEKTRQANVANQMGMAAALRGHSVGGALAQASEGAARVNSEAAANGAILRAKEQSDARNQLTGALSGARTQDTADAGQDLDWRKALLSGQLGANQTAGSTAGAEATASANAADSANKFKGGLIGGIAGAVPLLSDKREKTDIHAAGGEVQQILDALKPKGFEYRDPNAPGAGPGERIGVMAQDAAKGGPAGRAMIADGKPMTMDVGNSLGTTLAALGQMNQRLKRLEGHGAGAAA
jgi:hypothetical protein